MPITFESVRQNHADLLLDAVEHSQFVERSNVRALNQGFVKMPRVTSPRLVKLSLSQWQTGFRDQLDRASRYAFASCAAMEAAYRRQFGIVVDLSEQYVFHMNKVTTLLDDWPTSKAIIENNSTLVGFQGSSDVVDKLARFATVDENEAPYLTNVQMITIRVRSPRRAI